MRVTHVWVYRCVYTHGCDSIFVVVCTCAYWLRLPPQRPASYPAHPPPSTAVSHSELVRGLLLTALEEEA